MRSNLGKVVIHLYSAQLPFPSNSVAHHKVKFRPIKAASPSSTVVCSPFRVRSLTIAFCFFPVLLRSYIFFFVFGSLEIFVRKLLKSSDLKINSTSSTMLMNSS